MEKPTFTAIDYNSKENKVIEERIRNYYLPVKNTFEAVLYGRLNIPNSPRGLCGYLIFKCGMFSFIERMMVRLREY